ncbi:MAG TPA: PAS domain-containing protein [Marmoricola sp.]|nr:PAS domain-containing protein [Marmoricola sp.]
MLAAATIAQIESATWFRSDWAPYLLLDHDLRIRAVNTAYVQATAFPRERLLGENVFDVFPANADARDSGAAARLAASLERVLRTGARDWMGVQRYDVPDPVEPGRFVHRVWTSVNTPVKEDGRTVGVLHQTQDVTEVHDLVLEGLRPGRHGDATGFAAVTESLCLQFPDLAQAAVTGLLAHSHRAVARTLGAPDPEKAMALTVLRLELLAGHPPLTLPAETTTLAEPSDP